MLSRRSPPASQQRSQQQSNQRPNSPFNAAKSFGNFIPAKVEVRLAAPSNISDNQISRGSKPIDIVQLPIAKNATLSTPLSTPYKSEKKRALTNRRTAYNKNQAFGTPVDDPMMDEDFDFEKNLALFDKQAIWDEIDATQKPDLLRQAFNVKAKNYRHDENVLASKPTGYRQISTTNQCTVEYATDEGLIIPAVPSVLRDLVLSNAAASGLTWERQCDMLGRGTTEMAMLLLGGARRLTPNNRHQWPTIVIVCDEPYNEKSSEVGISTGRQLASHGLTVCIYVSNQRKSERKSSELDLFATSSKNKYTTSVRGYYLYIYIYIYFY